MEFEKSYRTALKSQINLEYFLRHAPNTDWTGSGQWLKIAFSVSTLAASIKSPPVLILQTYFSLGQNLVNFKVLV